MTKRRVGKFGMRRKNSESRNRREQAVKVHKYTNVVKVLKVREQSALFVRSLCFQKEREEKGVIEKIL